MRLKKRYIVLASLAVVIFAALFSLSTIVKNYLVSNGEKLTGRKIDIGELHFNFAHTALQVKDFVLYEANKRDSFVYFKELYINLNPWPLPFGEYSISEIRLLQPAIRLIQNGDKFNFESLLPKDSAEVDTLQQKKELKFTIRNISLKDGLVEYRDLMKNSQMKLKELNFDLPLIAWNNDQSNMGIDFNIGEKGHVNVMGKVDIKKKMYQIDLQTTDFELKPFTPYFKDYMDVKSISGLLTSRLKILGDMNEVTNISVSGTSSITDVSVVDGNSEKILLSPRITAAIRDINLKRFDFKFGKIGIEGPELLVVNNTDMTNLERFFLPYFHNDSITKASATSTDTSTVFYSIDTLKIEKGQLAISDNTLNRPFQYTLENLNVEISSLSSNAPRIPVTFDMTLNKQGSLSGKTILSMIDLMNVEMEAKVKRMDLISFSPYSEYYVAAPITKGWLNYDLGLKMSKTQLSNKNNVKVDKLEFGKRTKDKTAVKAPVRLGLYIMKDANDVIAFDLPVEGNPSDPQFKLRKIIWKTFTNLMVKIAVSPFRALAGIAGNQPESLEKLPFSYCQDSLDNEQRTNLTQLAEIIKKKPELILNLVQTTNPEEEKKELAVLLTKDDFISSKASDSNGLKVNSRDIKSEDPELLAFIRKSIPMVDSIGIHRACLKRIESARLESRFQTILTERNKKIVEFMTVKQNIPPDNINVTLSDLNNLPEELRIPQYKVEVLIK